jgi:hypothetical protein
MDEQPNNESMIVAAINYCNLANKGIFINWLGTSADHISEYKFGKQFLFECAGNEYWQQRHLAHFLIVVAKLSVETFALQNQDHRPGQFHIVLQTLIKQGESSY